MVRTVSARVCCFYFTVDDDDERKRAPSRGGNFIYLNVDFVCRETKRVDEAFLLMLIEIWRFLLSFFLLFFEQTDNKVRSGRARLLQGASRLQPVDTPTTRRNFCFVFFVFLLLFILFLNKIQVNVQEKPPSSPSPLRYCSSLLHIYIFHRVAAAAR